MIINQIRQNIEMIPYWRGGGGPGRREKRGQEAGFSRRWEVGEIGRISERVNETRAETGIKRHGKREV